MSVHRDALSKDRTAQVRRSFQTAYEIMAREGSIFSLVMGLLLVLFGGFFVYMLTGIFGFVLEEMTVLSYEAIEVLYWTSVALPCIFLLFPLMLGRLRMAGILACGGYVTPKESFYYFTSARRYLRGLWLGSFYALTLLALFGGLYAVATLPYLLYETVLSRYLLFGAAVLLLVLTYPVCMALLLLLLYLLGRFFCVVPLAVGNPDMGLLVAMRESLRITKGKRGAVFAFFWHCVWRILLSLATLGVLWVLYYAHATDTAYFDLTLSFWKSHHPE